MAVAGVYDCGDAADPDGITASDSLLILRRAVAQQACSRCECDADGNGKVTANDALFTLRKAVGQGVEMRCPFCCPLCACTPQILTLSTDDIQNCEGCIPRIPASNSDVDGITIDFTRDFNDDFELRAVAECVWEVVLPDAVDQKAFYHSGDTQCTGEISSVADGGGVLMRVVRTGGGWEVYGGTYTFALGWGDVVRASLESPSCESGADALSDNSTCHLATSGSPTDYDTHATGGFAAVTVTDPAPVCP